MRIDRLTSRLQVALSDAQSVALGKDHQFIEPVHLIQVLIDQNGSVSALLRQLSVDVKAFRHDNALLIDKLPVVEGSDGDIHMSNDLGRLLNLADKLSQKQGDQFISSEMVLLAALADKGSLGELFKKYKIERAALEKAVESVRGGDSVSDQGAEENRQALDKYTVDLTARAVEGKLDPVIGRDDEIRRTIQVLQRRRKNNPVLIGEPGVGKTAIVEGLAQRIVNGDVPQALQNRQLIALDMGSLIAGAKYRGEFEEAFEFIENEIKKQSSLRDFIDGETFVKAFYLSFFIF